MRLLDLFSGIGGFSLAAHWMGWETVAFVEKEPFCQKVLAKNFPGVPIFGDIHEFDGKPYRGTTDIICGGFPCQPFSNAGQKRGKDDERYLFPQMLRVVEEVAPRWVVAENVRGLLGNGNGKVFEEVATSLECVGYAVQTFCIPASAVNAPHRRERLWIVANSHGGQPFSHAGTNSKTEGEVRRHSAGYVSSGLAQRPHGTTTNGHGQRPQGANERKDRAGQSKARLGLRDWNEPWPQVAARLCRMDDVVPNRVDRLKALGNAIVPQVAFEIFKAIEQAENQ